jgi:hypothetical protein
LRTADHSAIAGCTSAQEVAIVTKPTITREEPASTTLQPDGAVAMPSDRRMCDPATKQGLSSRNRALIAQINLLELEPMQIAYLCDRWLPELDYLGKRARSVQRWHQWFQGIVVVGGVAITALTSLNLVQNSSSLPLGFTVDEVLSGAIFVLGLLVAAGGALEGSFGWGDRWRHFRLRSELLRGEGWAFLELTGSTYRNFTTHAEAFRTFVSRAERAIQEEATEYVAQLARTDSGSGGGYDSCGGGSNGDDSGR